MTSPQPTIRTERLLLRPAAIGDLDPIHAILSDEEASRYWSTPPHSDREESRLWLESMMTIPAGLGEDFVVEQEGRVIGKTGFYRFPEIGFIFHPAVWGRGLAAEALCSVLDRAFGVHGLPRAEADVDPSNQASLKLLARLGFVEHGRKARTWLIAGRWHDSVYLHLDRSAWEERRQPVC